MEEAQLTKKERKALKRQQKEDNRGREKRMRKTKKFVLWGGVVVAVGLLFWFGMQALVPEEAGEDHSREMPSEGVAHVAEGTRVQYESNPPTSGNHWPVPLRDGMYGTEKPDEAIIHSLEHGRVWVSYRPDVGEEVIQALEGLLKGQFGVILSPRPANETDIALSAWTRLDTFDLNEDGSFDEKRILDFISRYRNQGPEYVPQNTGKTYE